MYKKYTTRRRKMSKEDLGKLIDSKKFSKTMYCYGDDKLGHRAVAQALTGLQKVGLLRR